MCKFLMDSYHFISTPARRKSISIRFASSFFCANVCFFFSHIDRSIIVYLFFLLVCFGIDLHFFAHKITLWFVFTTPHFWVENLRCRQRVWKRQRKGKGRFCERENNVGVGKRRKSLNWQLICTIIDRGTDCAKRNKLTAAPPYWNCKL